MYFIEKRQVEVLDQNALLIFCSYPWN